MSIEVINSFPSLNVHSQPSSNPINSSDVATFQSLVAEAAATSEPTTDTAQAAALADFYKQVQYDIVNMCIHYSPTFRG